MSMLEMKMGRTLVVEGYAEIVYCITVVYEVKGRGSVLLLRAYSNRAGIFF
jgi:hypothetical protein